MVQGDPSWIDLTNSFRPLTGMVQRYAERNRVCLSFRPLTGMVLVIGKLIKNAISFRPLTGMVLLWGGSEIMND